MTNSLEVIVFDVNETLSDLSSMADRFTEVGAPPHLATEWFSGLLRDGFALAAAESRANFAVIARESLHDALGRFELNRPLEASIDHVMHGFSRLALHPDVVAAVRDLAHDGRRLITLSNGSATIADDLFRTAGIRASFDLLLSVENAPGWKPLRSAYEYAAAACGVESSRMLLVAVHPWDIHGAASAGLRTAWVNRTDASYPSYFTPPDIVVSTLAELAPALRRLG